MTAVKAPQLALLVAALALCACDDYVDSGPVRSETRELGAFDSIEVEGTARLEIAVGGTQSVIVEGRERIIDSLVTEVRRGTLYVESKPGHWLIGGSGPRLTLRIALPQLASLKLEGGNDVRVSGFDGGESNIDVTGAAHIKADGRLDELTVRMAGAGHADLSRLVVQGAKVTLDGVGSVIVHPKDTLDATMNGVGAILYEGSPREVNTRMNGLGTIGQRNTTDRDRGGAADDESIEPQAPPPERERSREPTIVDSTEVI